MDPARAKELALRLDITVEDPDALYDVPCDVFSPNAVGGTINEHTIPRLRCRIVAGGANNQLESLEDAERLRARDILYAPDYVINVGGAMGVLGMELSGWSRARAEQEVAESVRRALGQVFDLAVAEGITTEAAARRIAEARLSAA
jgi:leucine dehydrogenase